VDQPYQTNTPVLCYLLHAESHVTPDTHSYSMYTFRLMWLKY